MLCVFEITVATVADSHYTEIVFLGQRQISGTGEQTPSEASISQGVAAAIEVFDIN
jgi:hypothetical protein